MWSVWSECVHIYVATGLALVRHAGMPLVRMNHAPTLPFADVLERVDEAGKRSASGKPWRLRVSLSASLCPPVAFAVPKGIRRGSELQALATASAAAQWNVPAGDENQIICALDPIHTSLTAVMHAGTHQQLQAWAQRFGGRLMSLQPLWAVATQAKICRSPQVHGLRLREPDALTVLSFASDSSARAESALGTSSPDSGKDEGLVDLRFSAVPLKPSQVWRKGPASWPNHWEQLT